MPTEQNLTNHGRIVPAYHIGALLPLLANFVWAAYRTVTAFGPETVLGLLVAIALLLMFFSLRLQILTVQDRVIRLEMRLRLARILPASMHASIPQLTHKQLVALRFAGDAELPALVSRVLAGELPTQKAIKSQVRDWQADYLRA